MKSIYEKILNKKLFVFATCGFGGDKTYYSKLLERVEITYFLGNLLFIAYKIASTKLNSAS